jgi:hypothetical protein
MKFAKKKKKKLQGQLARGVLLQHDNARSHIARAAHERIQELQWTLLEHPLYGPELASSDFHLKTHLDGKCFADDEEVETEVRKWLRQQSKDFYVAGFDALAKPWTSVQVLVEDMSRNKCFSRF